MASTAQNGTATSGGARSCLQLNAAMNPSASKAGNGLEPSPENTSLVLARKFARSCSDVRGQSASLQEDSSCRSFMCTPVVGIQFDASPERRSGAAPIGFLGPFVEAIERSVVSRSLRHRQI